MATRKKARIEIGRGADGKPTYKWVDGTTTKDLHDAIVRAYIEYGLVETLVGTVSEDKPLTKQKFKAYVSKWLETYKAPKLKPTTMRGYISMLNAHLYPTFGKVFMDKISTEDIQGFLNDRKHLAKKTLKELVTFLNLIFEDALEDNVVEKNPTKSRKLVIPSDKKTEREALTVEQIKEILSRLQNLDTDERRLMALLMFTGMRRGEALGLKWEDIDRKANCIHVQHNVTYATNQPYISSPKSESGYRIIPLVPILWELLNHKGEIGFIIGGENPITHMVFRGMWKRINKAIDLYGASAHIFRHTFLTILSNMGVQPKIIQVIAGHADISTTMNTYVDGQMLEITNAGKLLEDLFGNSDVA